MDDMINNGMDIPKWMTTGKTILCQKYPGEGIAVDNKRPISCLPFIWRLMTGIIATSAYDFFLTAAIQIIKMTIRILAS